MRSESRHFAQCLNGLSPANRAVGALLSSAPIHFQQLMTSESLELTDKRTAQFLPSVTLGVMFLRNRLKSALRTVLMVCTKSRIDKILRESPENVTSEQQEDIRKAFLFLSD